MYVYWAMESNSKGLKKDVILKRNKYYLMEKEIREKSIYDLKFINLIFSYAHAYRNTRI